jgi:hypothetical protein
VTNHRYFFSICLESLRKLWKTSVTRDYDVGKIKTGQVQTTLATSYIVQTGKYWDECKDQFQFAEKNQFLLNSCLAVSNTIGQYFVMLNTRNNI